MACSYEPFAASAGIFGSVAVAAEEEEKVVVEQTPQEEGKEEEAAEERRSFCCWRPDGFQAEPSDCPRRIPHRTRPEALCRTWPVLKSFKKCDL